MELAGLLGKVCGPGVSDIHFKAGRPPVVRRNGQLVNADYPRLTPSHTGRIAKMVLPKPLQAALVRQSSVCTSYWVPQLGRFRVSFFRQRGSIEAVFRFIPVRLPVRGELGLTGAVAGLVQETSGLILVTGPASSGRSTTGAWLVAEVAQRRRAHILTIEDPIEHVIADALSSVDQVELGMNGSGLGSALRLAGRQDVNVLMVGPPVTDEALEAMLALGRAGMLVIGYLTAASVRSAVDWILESCSGRASEARLELALTTIRAVVGQRLVMARDGSRRIAAQEVLRMESGVANALASGASWDAVRALQHAADPEEMHTLEWHLIAMAKREEITVDQALAAAQVASEVERELLL